MYLTFKKKYSISSHRKEKHSRKYCYSFCCGIEYLLTRSLMHNHKHTQPDYYNPPPMHGEICD